MVYDQENVEKIVALLSLEYLCGCEINCFAVLLVNRFGALEIYIKFRFLHKNSNIQITSGTATIYSSSFYFLHYCLPQILYFVEIVWNCVAFNNIFFWNNILF